MTAYVVIADSDIDPESPGTTTLFTRLRDNPIAITEGSTGAPKVQTAAITDDNVTNTKLTNPTAGGAYNISTVAPIDGGVYSTSATTDQKGFEIKNQGPPGVVRVNYTLTNGGTGTVGATVYKNGVAAAAQDVVAGSGSFVKDISVAYNDTIEVRFKQVTAAGVAQVTNVFISSGTETLDWGDTIR